MKEENEKAALKFNVQKPKIMASGPITSWQIDGETKETVTDYFLGREGGCGARSGVGDSGGVWEALAVAARGRDTPEPPPCSPHG